METWKERLWIIIAFILFALCIIVASIYLDIRCGEERTPDVDGRYHGFTEEELEDISEKEKILNTINEVVGVVNHEHGKNIKRVY